MPVLLYAREAAESRENVSRGSTLGSFSPILTICTLVHILSPVEVEWDARKAAANVGKHRVDFADAATVFHDELAVTIHDDDPGEERFVTIGMDALGRTVIVVYTWRGDRVRLISARRATSSERRRYEGAP